MKFSSFKTCHSFFTTALALGLAGTVITSSQSAQAVDVTQGKTPTPSYVKNLRGNKGYKLVPLLTVGDEVDSLLGDFQNGFTTNSNQKYAFAGIPDGLGLFQQGDFNYVFVNHEISSSNSSFLNSTNPAKIQGARVSLFKFDKNWNVLGGKNLIETAYDPTTSTHYQLNTTTGKYEPVDSITATALSFTRFCSGYLAQQGFTGAPTWFAPEETTNANGSSFSRGWAVASSDSDSGQAQALNGLGRYAKENVVSPLNYRAGNATGKTVLLSTEDYTDGEIYLFVGQQTLDDPNGFKDGDLYVLKIDGAHFEGEVSEGIPTTATWTLVDDSAALSEDGTLLSQFVNQPGKSTNFRRPEDIAEDPNNPGTFYFVTTGTKNLPTTDTTNPLTPDASTPTEAENPYGRLYRFSLNPNDPTGLINNFELLLKGGPGTCVSYDNVVVDSNGNVLIQEDETSFGGDVMRTENRDGRVCSYNIATDTIRPLFQIDQTVVGTKNPVPGAWETSGIIEIDPNAEPGRSSYLFDVQAHTIKDSRYVEGGQLILARPIPEPGAIVGLTLFGLSALGSLRRRNSN